MPDPRPDPASAARAIGQAAPRALALIGALLGRQAAAPLSLDWLRSQIRSSDLREHALRIGTSTVHVLYLFTIVDMERLAEDVLRPLEQGPAQPLAVLARAEAAATDAQALEALLNGRALVIQSTADGARAAVAVDVVKRPARSVSPPNASTILAGPRNAFIEDLTVNVGLIRSIVTTPLLRVEECTLGTVSRTPAVLLHVEGRCDPDHLRRVRDALASVRTDYVLSDITPGSVTWQSGYTPFPLSLRSERPDVVAGKLFQGRLAIFVQGSPFALVVPATLLDVHLSVEAPLGSPLITTFIRVVRLAGIGVGLLCAPLYVALLGVDPTVVPPLLLTTIAATRQGLPYPVTLETLLMLGILDAITIAAEVAPGALGQALTIVGSLIIGQAAVQARLTSTLMVIVLSLVLIGNLLVQDLRLAYALRLVKYPLVLLASLSGLIGLAAGVLMTGIHLCSLKSLDIPYLTFVAPTDWRTIRKNSLWTVPRKVR